MVKQKLDGYLYMTPASFIFFLLAPGIGLITIALHRSEPVFQLQNVPFLIFAGTWLLLLSRVRFVTEDALGGWTRTGMFILACTTGVMVVQVIVAWFMKPETYLVQPVFIYLFYINAAISEEILFRVFLCTLVIIIVQAIPVKKKLRVTRRAASYIAAVAISGIAFSLSHLGVYASAPLMLLSTLLGGTIMATCFVISKNPMVPIAAHVINNAIAAGVIVTNCIIQVIV